MIQPGSGVDDAGIGDFAARGLVSTPSSSKVRAPRASTMRTEAAGVFDLADPDVVVANALYPDAPTAGDDPASVLWRRRRAINTAQLERLDAFWAGPLAEVPLLAMDPGPRLVGAVARRLADAALLSSVGNSGIILAQFLDGQDKIKARIAFLRWWREHVGEPVPAPRLIIGRLELPAGRLEADASALGVDARQLEFPGFVLEDLGGQDGAPANAIGKDVLTRLAKEAAQATLASELQGQLEELLEDKVGDDVKDKVEDALEGVLGGK